MVNAVYACMYSQIDKFADELEEFKEEMENVLGVCWEDGEGEKSVGRLGTLQDAVEVREEMGEVGSGVLEAVNTVKVRTSVYMWDHCVNVVCAGAD